MTPPPPPSPSYKLNLDEYSSSSEDERVDVMGRRQRMLMGRNDQLAEEEQEEGLSVCRRNDDDDDDEDCRRTRSEVSLSVCPSMCETENYDDEDDEDEILAKSGRIEDMNMNMNMTKNDKPEEEEEDVEDSSDDDDNDEEEDGARNAKKKKKKRTKKKKSKKKKRKKKTTTLTTQQQQQQEDSGNEWVTVTASSKSITSTNATCSSSIKVTKKTKNVAFGVVSVREYTRCLGLDVVPGVGGWPLGLSNDVLREYDVPGGVEGFEQSRQEELKRRWVSVMTKRHEQFFNKQDHHRTHNKKGKHHNKHKETQQHHNMELKDVHPPQGTLETRQFDYRIKKKLSPQEQRTLLQQNNITPLLLRDGKNPLFGLLTEEERQKILIRDMQPKNDSSDHDDAEDDHPKHHHRKNNKSNHHQRPRSQSNASTTSSDLLHDTNDIYSTTDIMHIRNELEQIRIHRSGEGSAGCTCRKIHVNLPSTNSKSKKNTKRLPIRKLQEELRRRGLLGHHHDTTTSSHNEEKKEKESPTREDMELMLYHAVEKEPCCWSKDCPCVRNSIPCQADTCSCWHPGHDSVSSSTKHASSSSSSHNHKNDALAKLVAAESSVDMIQNRCGNVHGMYVVNFRKIDEYRKPFFQIKSPSLMKMNEMDNGVVLCQPTSCSS